MRTLIVDGYNVIRATPPYQHLAESDDVEAARVALVSDVAAFASGQWDATVVFDGGGNPTSDGLMHDMAGVHVVFSRFGTDADALIERLSRTARERADEVVVVTSDAQLQWTVMGSGVVRMSAPGFGEELRCDRDAWGEHTPAGSSRGLLEDRIPADIRETLARWARGQ